MARKVSTNFPKRKAIFYDSDTPTTRYAHPHPHCAKLLTQSTISCTITTFLSTSEFLLNLEQRQSSICRMSMNRSHPSMPQGPKTVGSIADASLLDYPYSADECEIVEFRLDGLLRNLEQVRNVLIKLKASQLQTLITARCQSEGGLAPLTSEQRSQLIGGLSPLATFVDIELANLAEMQPAADLARTNGALVVASFHDFKKTPDTDFLRDKIRQAVDLGADIVKMAVHHNSLDDMHRCATLMQEGHPIGISLMGMGTLAPVSRVLYSQLGSLLNYGYLGNKETAPGQWPASLLSQAIRTCKPF
ncbi:type I 3-dehydroquinate dehydratase [Rubritalea tangerina]|uniref:3-dehydroquinate dehydratase n=1 Tax=Rubritalea tangerina TaxID=430798 RepID=A0ABW4Z922_9BACT